MKSKEVGLSSEGFAFDDDTSDSDDDQLEAFKNKVGTIQPSNKTKSENRDCDKSDSNGSDFGDTENESEDTDESDSDVTGAGVQFSLSAEKKDKLSKLQQQLAGFSKDEELEETDDESSDDEKSDKPSEVECKESLNDEFSCEEVETVDEDCDNVGQLAASEVVNKRSPEKISQNKRQLEETSKEEKERLKYRDKLAKMSIEEIHQLKERLGLKLFHQKMSGTAPIKGKKIEFKRENKNRPREMSSKKTVGRFREVIQVAKEQKRDPRFDPLCGEFDDKLFKENYKFVNEIKSQDLTFLKKQIREEEDPERRKAIKYLIQRTENQLRQEAQNKVKEEEKAAEKSERQNELKAGVKPFYVSKSKQKEIKLVDQFEKLKEKGGLDNYIKKKTKKNLIKDRKKFENL